MATTIYKAGVKLDHKRFLFPAGEIGIKLAVPNLLYLSTTAPYQTIVARLRDSVDVMELIMVTDALRRFDSMPIRLFMPYVPYGRQDRVCVLGEASSLLAFARLINSLAYERVTIVDPHSDVTPSVLDRVRVISQLDIFNHPMMETIRNRLMGMTLVSPDAGANKKIAVLAGYLNHAEFIRADKRRNLATGEIIETIVYGDVAGREVAIVDDLVDGGKSFTELAKVLKAKGAARVILFATHGIFSKGTEVVYKGGIDEIYTTDAYSTTLGIPNTLKLEEAFPL